MSTLVVMPADELAAAAPQPAAAAATSPPGLRGIQKQRPDNDRTEYAQLFPALQMRRDDEGGGSSTGRLYVKGASEIVLELCRWQVSRGSRKSGVSRT